MTKYCIVVKDGRTSMINYLGKTGLVESSKAAIHFDTYQDASKWIQSAGYLASFDSIPGIQTAYVAYALD